MLKKGTEKILDILACPVCKKKVKLENDKFVCADCKVYYLIDEEGIPVMLKEKGVRFE